VDGLEGFDYALPPELIAQVPLERREDSRLLVLHRTDGTIAHRSMRDLPRLLRRGDLLVLNDTRVLPARLPGVKESGGRIEVLLLERLSGSPGQAVWACLLARAPRPGGRFVAGEGVVGTVLTREGERGTVLLERDGGELDAALERAGRVPLPPYIRRGQDHDTDAEDRERYQTLHARVPGAAAAPTAGLHFTPRLLRRLADGGVDSAFLTLHVGLGTFLPLRSARLEDHVMHEEAYHVPPDTAEAVRRTRSRGGRVVAVGTTVVRALEDSAGEAGEGRCRLFIRPGFRFRVVDALVTNFHLPRSTLLVLVSALAGRERVLAAYAEAVRERYRFLSYGDAMLVADPA
jgi:S-adenosylmethionine:tRNA ribosyltransferase-isomerase